MPTLTQGDIQVESAIPIVDIQDFRMEIQENNHAYVRREGIVSDEEGEECFLQPMAGTRITVRVDDRILFEGMLKEAQMKQEGMGYHVSLTGVSLTELLDYQKKCRTFQDTSMSYQEVMEQILADVPDAKLHFHVEDEAIGMPLYQIEETDWAFIRRLAGRLNTGIITSPHLTMPNIHIGILKGGKREPDSETVSKRMHWEKKAIAMTH